ncbi:MAG: hypothetical protein FWH04_00080 [Oscillospiraceae bacterium]|nr:hypothetical protein [Oscillospiraceae bacterium]
MDIKREIQDARDELLNQMDVVFEKLIEQVVCGVKTNEIRGSKGFEREYRLTSNPSIFKGKKPIHMTIKGEQIEVSTWKAVVSEIMKHCNADVEKHVELMNLRGKISGKKRAILAKNDNGMRGPIKIDENLYLEAHYDTESLLRTVLTRVLDVVGYDYSGITIKTRAN